MLHKSEHKWLGWLGIGLLGGLVLSGLMPNSPLHAVATDRTKTFAMATGLVDDDIEAVFFLDFLTGNLNATVLSRETGRFTVCYAHNVLNDLGIDRTKNPRYLMVTGQANLRQGLAPSQLGRVVVYVAELTSGRVAAYALLWSPAMKNFRHPVRQLMKLLDVTQFRNIPAVQSRE